MFLRLFCNIDKIEDTFNYCPEGAIKNGKSRETGNIGHTRLRQQNKNMGALINIQLCSFFSLFKTKAINIV
jgi:hypothetical protein